MSIPTLRGDWFWWLVCLLFEFGVLSSDLVLMLAILGCLPALLRLRFLLDLSPPRFSAKEIYR